MSVWKYLFLLLCLILSITLSANTLSYDSLSAQRISEFVLDNGLKVIVKPDHRSPTVVFQIWYKVGSANEKKHHTGVSHLLEHMMYRGNNNPSSEDVYEKISSIGAKGNAYTSRDYTFYYHILTKQHLSLAFALEADRMKRLTINKKGLSIEKNVVREEILDNISRDPYLPALNALYDLAYQQEPYQIPAIGLMTDQSALTPAYIKSWHEQYYTPDNSTLVIVGDVIASDVFKLANQYFSSIRKIRPMKNKSHQPAKSHQPVKSHQPTISHQPTKGLQPASSHQPKNRRIVMPETTSVAMILLAFKVPSIKTSTSPWEAYALDILAGWLDSGFHSRLTKKLLREAQIAQDVYVTYTLMDKKGSLFIIEATAAHNISVEQLEQAVIEEINEIKNETISQEVLKKIQTQMIATDIFERDSMYTQAKIIGQSESVDITWQEDAQYISRIKSVTVAQVKEVMLRYFQMGEKFTVIQKMHPAEK